MRRIFKLSLAIIITIAMLIGCSKSEKEVQVKCFINKLIAQDTYKDITAIDENPATYIEDCKLVFGDEFTKEAFDTLMANRTFAIYKEVLTSKDVNKISNLKITKKSETKNKGYIYLEYEVTYKLEKRGGAIEMIDYMTFNVIDDKSYIIKKVSIESSTSSVYKEFKKTVQ